MKSPQLRRDIRFLGAAFLVLNGFVGAGIFALPGRVAENAGLFSPWLFLIVGALFLSVILCFAELAGRYDRTGGPALYATDAFGPFVGFSTGWAIYLSRVTAFAANANVLATYASSLHESLDTPVVRMLMVALVTIGLTVTNITGVRDGVRTMGLFTILKISPLIVMILIGLGELTASTVLPPSPFSVEELGATTLLLIYAYVGFETVGVTAGETREAKRTIPWALVWTMAATALLYFFIVLVFVAVIPAENYAESTLVDVGRSLAGPIGALIITLTAVFSIGGNLAGSMISAPRLVYSMALSRSLPKALARVHPRFDTPHMSILLTGTLGLLLGLTGSFVLLAVASSVIRLLGYVICIAALLRLRERGPSPGFEISGGPIVPVLAFIICVVLMAFSTLEAWTMVGALLAVGGLLYMCQSVSNEPRISGERLMTSATLLMVFLLATESGDNVVRLSEPVAETETHEVFGSDVAFDGAALTVNELLGDADDHVDQTVLVETRVAQVCQKKGCFFIAQQGDASIRVSFKDYGFFVPTDIGGKTVRLAGTLTRIERSAEQAAHFESDAPGAAFEAGPAYELVADAVRVPKG